MKKLTNGDAASRSADIVGANIAHLRALLPEAFTEGKIDFEVLKQLLGGTVDEREEKFGLQWHGKRRARQLALTPSTGTLRPCPDESVDWEKTHNLVIEGDNLEVLKLLQKSYAGQIKLVYIDPPYNTGNDFVYPDDFVDSIRNYLALTGQSDRDGRKRSSNTEASGRFHTDWLNMMYPRIKLARNLMRDDGVLLVHIDEHELTNVAAMLADIFGEENMLGTAVWDKKNPKGDSTRLAYQHESILIVAKNHASFAAQGGLTRHKKNAEAILAKGKQLFARLGKQDLPADLKGCARRYELAESAVVMHRRTIDLALVNQELGEWIRNQDFSGGETAYSKIDESGAVYRLVSMAWPNKKAAPDEYFVPLKHPRTGEPCPVPDRGWRNPPETMARLLEAGEIVFGADHSVQPQRKYTLRENMTENFPSVVGYAGSDDAMLAELGIPFEHPKPVELAAELIASIVSNDDIVLDFFAGSGTAGHATMRHNAARHGSVRFLLVQLPEPLDPADKTHSGAVKLCDGLGKPRTIAELTKERLRRAGARLRKEDPTSEHDVGFRVFKLDSSNIRAWDPDRADLAQSVVDSIDHLKPDRTEQDILFELLLKLGLDLTAPIDERKIAGKAVHSVGSGTLLACLATTIAVSDVEPLAMGILAWHEEIAPREDVCAIFRDCAFADDVAKSNFTAILRQHGLTNVRSL